MPESRRAQADAIHLQVKTQGEIELAKIKAALDAKMTVLETHLKAAIEMGKAQRAYPAGARKTRGGHQCLPDAPRRKSSAGRSSCLIILWCRSSISRTLKTSPSFRSNTIRSVIAARSRRRGLNKRKRSQRRKPSRKSLQRAPVGPPSMERRRETSLLDRVATLPAAMQEVA
ncbi:hypothetical protein [uncultured Bradyrhizobium sp.]|uniref:hypothetical protein n=1 Tax=uncultured Bradyrhizobium sp. TaxID=199684 RepID=UPI002625DC55|nr:hypothetical protein [uncultured Bradyrhizobium sp.]